MGPMQLGDLCDDPDFAQPAGVTIIRSKGVQGPGGWQNSTVSIASSGTIVPADAEALDAIPPADRVTGSIQFLTQTPIFETQESRQGVSDQVQWNGNLYRVQSVTPWKDYGFFAAILVRITGS